MYYLTFTLTDPETTKVTCIGVKYKRTPFSESEVEKIRKIGTTNLDVKNWLRSLKRKKLMPAIDVIYRGEDSAEACWHKQQFIINHTDERYDLIGVNTTSKQYTKRIRENEHLRRPIVDQHGVRYPGILQAAEQLLLAPSNISKVLYERLDHIGGYKFKFDQSAIYVDRRLMERSEAEAA